MTMPASSSMVAEPAAGRARIVCNRRIARDTLRIRLREPQLAQRALPGQFFMIRQGDSLTPLLARPLALYDIADDAAGRPTFLDLVYQVLGPGTRALAALRPDAEVQLWGPLGQPFPAVLPGGSDAHVLIVAGGIGQTPFVAVTRELLGQRRFGDRQVDPLARKVTVAYGVRSAEFLAGVEDLRSAGAVLHLATDDGTLGHAGYVTDLAGALCAAADRPTALFACGPAPMLQAVARLGVQHALPAWVALEEKMACGYGVCFSCVCPVRTAGAAGWDYRRTCLAGPVFPADQIAWEQFRR